MELYFVRHGQGEHVMNPPQSLQITDPSLTEVGKWQANKLSEAFPIKSDDLFVISPLRRTIQTALYWMADVECRKIVHPLVGPRMFPLLSPDKAYGCDSSLPLETIKDEFPQLETADVPTAIWEKGINTISDEDFSRIAQQFIAWCKSVNRGKIYIVSHDGTITAYRQYLGERVTREHFLGDTGWYKAIV